jgi:hypothetical protein
VEAARLLRETEQARLRALVNADMDAAGPLHADDYQLITPRGVALSRDEYLGLVETGELRYRTFEPATPIAVRHHGDAALLRYQARIIVGPAAEPDAGLALITCWHTDSYERRDGRWQAVWSQATAITAGD